MSLTVEGGVVDSGLLRGSEDRQSDLDQVNGVGTLILWNRDVVVVSTGQEVCELKVGMIRISKEKQTQIC